VRDGKLFIPGTEKFPTQGQKSFLPRDRKISLLGMENFSS